MSNLIDELTAEIAALPPKLAKATGGDLDAVALAVCNALRGQSHAEIARFTIGPNADRRVVNGVLSAPALLSGVSNELRGHIEADFISRYTAKDMAKIAQSEEALKVVETCVSALKTEAVEAFGMTPPAFDAWFGKEFAPTDAQLRAEDSEFVAREADSVLEAAGPLPLSQRIQLVGSLMDRNTAEVRKTA